MNRCNGHAERGAVTMIVILVLLMVVGASMLMLSDMVRSSVSDSVLEDDSVAALFLAESGLERATHSYAVSEACTAAGVGAGTYAFGRGQFTVSTTGGSGSSCTVQSIGTIGNVTRLLERTIDYNVVANGNFESPGTCPPAGWTVSTTSAAGCATVGGNTVLGVMKTSSGPPVETVAFYTFTSPVVGAAAGTSVEITYDYAVQRLVPQGGNSVDYVFQLNFTDGTNDVATMNYTPNIPLTEGTVTLTIPAGRVVANLTITMRANGSPRVATIDNIVFNAGATARLMTWSEPEI